MTVARRALGRVPGPARLDAICAAFDAIMAPGSPPAARTGGAAEAAALALDLIELAAAEGPAHGPSLGLLSPLKRWVPTDGSLAELALDALVARYASLTSDARSLVRGLGDRRLWAAAGRLAERLGSEPGQAAESLAAFIEERPGMRAAPIAARLLTVPRRPVFAAAESALVRIARAASEGRAHELPGEDPAGLPRSDGAVARAVAEAIERCVSAYGEHQRRGPLVAALLLLGSARRSVAAAAADVLSPWLTETRHPAGGAIRSVLKKVEDPGLRAASVRWLADGRLARPALDRLSVSHGTADQAALLERSHLFLHPARARRARLLEPRARRAPEDREGGGEACSLTTHPVERGGVLPTEGECGGLSVAARRGLPRLVRTVQPTREVGRGALAPLLSDRDPVVRLLAAAAADPMDLPDFCCDPSPLVAGSAARRWSRAGWAAEQNVCTRPAERARASLSRRLCRSPHAGVRAIAAAEADRGDPWAWQTAAGRLAARRWLLAEREAFREAAQERLRTGSDPVVMGTLRTLVGVSAVGLLLDDVLELVTADGVERTSGPAGAAADGTEGAPACAHVLATAVAALGRIASGGEMGRRIDAALALAWERGDGRVRANAVEASSRRSRLRPSGPSGGADRLRDAMLGLVDDEHQRTRANALRGLLSPDLSSDASSRGGPSGGGPGRRLRMSRVYEPAAVEAFESMLADERPGHRLSALWLAERVLCGPGGRAVGDRWERLVRTIARVAQEDAEPRARRRAARCTRRLLAELREGFEPSPGPDPARSPSPPDAGEEGGGLVVVERQTVGRAGAMGPSGATQEGGAGVGAA